jgi:resuscitation-promoting factor RpfA
VEEIEIHLRRAAPWKRAASWVVDGLLLGLIGALLFSLVASMSGLSATGAGPSARQTGLDWLIDGATRHQGLVLPTLAVLAAASFVHATLGHALMGATLGKRLLGLRVVGRDGRRPTLGRSAVRAALALLSFLLLGLGCLLALFTVSGRALHDFLAGTYVVERDRTLA